LAFHSIFNVDLVPHHVSHWLLPVFVSTTPNRHQVQGKSRYAFGVLSWSTKLVLDAPAVAVAAAAAAAAAAGAAVVEAITNAVYEALLSPVVSNLQTLPGLKDWTAAAPGQSGVMTGAGVCFWGGCQRRRGDTARVEGLLQQQDSSRVA
jgi:hypothetical protein